MSSLYAFAALAPTGIFDGPLRPEAVLQLKTLPTKKGRTNPSLTGPKTLLNETI
jgi:hypothetical protein